jgi:predicted PurR-regulated permease PerM
MSGITFDSGRSRLYWWLFTAVLAAVVVAVLFGFVGALVLGLFVYYATRPIYARIASRTPSRTLAAGLALTLIALPVIVLVVYTVAAGVSELRALLGTGLTAYEGILGPYLDLSAVTTGPDGLFGLLNEESLDLRSLGNTETIRGVLAVLGSYAQAFVFALLQAFVALIVAFYLLRDDHRLASWFRSAISGPDSAVGAYMRAVDRDLQTIYFGNILNAFVVAVVSALSFNALNLIAPTGLAIPAPTLLGLLTGAASLVPVVGMKVVYVPVGAYLAGVALVTDTALVWFPVAFVLVSLVVVDGLTEVLLRPYISGRDLHVGLVLFAYIIGPVVFGWYGLFLGPLLLVLVVHLARIVVPELVRGEPVTPSAVGADPIPDSRPSARPGTVPGRASTGSNETSRGDGADGSDGPGATDAPERPEEDGEGRFGGRKGPEGPDGPSAPGESGTEGDESGDRSP